VGVVLHELTGREAGLLSLLFPHLSGLDLDRVEELGGSVKIAARAGSGPVACRDCRTPSARVHDRYRRCLQDLACGGRPVQARAGGPPSHLRQPGLPVATFAEQVEGLTAGHQRRTAGLRSLLERVALAGRAGSRLARLLGAVVSRFTLIRLVRAMPDLEIGQVTVLGSTTGPSGAASPAPASWWTWTATASSTSCPTGRPAPSPTGSAHTPASS
jgi:hypothetical protein